MWGFGCARIQSSHTRSSRSQGLGAAIAQAVRGVTVKFSEYDESYKTTLSLNPKP